jgi:hypothetical protein
LTSRTAPTSRPADPQLAVASAATAILLLGGCGDDNDFPRPAVGDLYALLISVLEFNTSPDAPAEAVAERQAIFDSIQIEP